MSDNYRRRMLQQMEVAAPEATLRKLRSHAGSSRMSGISAWHNAREQQRVVMDRALRDRHVSLGWSAEANEPSIRAAGSALTGHDETEAQLLREELDHILLPQRPVTAGDFNAKNRKVSMRLRRVKSELQPPTTGTANDKKIATTLLSQQHT